MENGWTQEWEKLVAEIRDLLHRNDRLEREVAELRAQLEYWSNYRQI